MIFENERDVEEYASKFDVIKYGKDNKYKLGDPVINIDAIQSQLKDLLDAMLENGFLQHRVDELGLAHHYVYNLVRHSFSTRGMSYITLFKLYALLDVSFVPVWLMADAEIKDNLVERIPYQPLSDNSSK